MPHHIPQSTIQELADNRKSIEIQASAIRDLNYQVEELEEENTHLVKYSQRNKWFSTGHGLATGISLALFASEQNLLSAAALVWCGGWLAWNLSRK